MEITNYITKYALPSKTLLEAELGLLSFEDNDDIIVKLIKSLRGKIAKFISFAEELLQPDSTLINLQESNALSQEDGDKLFILFKKLVLLQRTYLSVYLDGSHEDKVTYFKQLFAGWQDCKPQLKPFIDKILHVWSDTQSFQEIKQNYFG